MAGMSQQVASLFEPIFTESPPPTPPGAPPPAPLPPPPDPVAALYELARRDEAAVKTYRYLRLGMVVIVVAIAAAVAVELSAHDCFQTSISAYYYTPARPVFVGGLLAIGVSLIVIKGNTGFEDVCLNVAGMFAPVVAFVPTDLPTADLPTCASVSLEVSAVQQHTSLAPFVSANVHNNLKALVVAGFVALAIAVVVYCIEKQSVTALFTDGNLGTRLELLGLLVFLLVVAFAVWRLDSVVLASHGWAAVIMFGFLALAALGNAFGDKLGGEESTHKWQYLAVGVAMVLVAFALLPSRTDGDHRVLIVEVLEITLFATFWVIQSVERWGKTV